MNRSTEMNTERILIVEVSFWFVALGWLAFRRS